MKRFLAGLLLVMMLCTWCAAEKTKLVELGIPTLNRFNEKQLHSRNVWDMALKDGMLYIGSGDYSANTGPAYVFGCSLETGEWSRTGVLSDEAVIRFVEIGDELLIPGTDPTSDWTIGYYYTLQEGKWKSSRVPYAVHMYDIVDFDGKRFVGIGTSGDYYSPAKASADGKKYEDVPFVDKEGNPVLGKFKYEYSRVYDMFVFDGELYCFCIAFPKDGSNYYGFFRYEDGAFRLWSQPSFLALRGSRQNRFYAKEKMNGALYIAFDRLYKTTDMEEVEVVKLPDNGTVQDLYLEAEGADAGLYVLGSLNIGGGKYTTTIWRYTDESGFESVYSFEYTTSAMSFVKDGEDFYVGMGRYVPNGTVKDEGMGMVFHVDR